MRHKTTITALIIGGLLIAAAGVLAWKTVNDLQPLPYSLNFENSRIRKVQILDRAGIPLTVTYRNRWNIHDYVPLHEIPPLLQQAVVASEDRRFYRHHGVDWRARLMALLQNIRSFRAVRGASTITEQVVRMWRPRPRTLWSRWLEGFEAYRLEKVFSKEQLLECYLNQVPYTAQRRGVVQAARYAFEMRRGFDGRFREPGYDFFEETREVLGNSSTARRDTKFSILSSLHWPCNEMDC